MELTFISDPAPALEVQFRPPDDERRRVRVRHRAGGPADASTRAYLSSLGKHPSLAPFRAFYEQYDGVEVCITDDAHVGRLHALLEFKPGGQLKSFTARYLPGGDLAWTIDLNKSAAIYRSAMDWVAFAAVAGGPACLILFTTGELAGNVCYLTPQPSFNILKPVARGFDALLDRLSKDLPAFLRLVRARVKIRCADGANYGFVPVGYISDADKLI